MNLATLERMIREGDLSRDGLIYLLNCRAECEWLDYKESLQLELDKSICDFTKDVIAMKNVGGGFIVVGVRDKTWEQVGLSSPLPYDAKMLRDKVMRGSGLSLDVDIVDHVFQDTGRKKHFALIFIRASKKRSKRRVPSLVAKDFCGNQTFGLRRGEIYARQGDSTVRISSQTELETLLDELEEHADALQLSSAATPSPFAIDDGTYRLLDKGFESFVGRLDLRQKVLEAVLKDPRIWIVNVHGPGGVGKSALVNWATYEFYRHGNFEAILQLTAKETMLTDSGIRSYGRSLYSLDNLLDHILALFQESVDREFEDKKRTVIEILSAWKTLIVLDNMETVSDGRVLSFVQELPPSINSKILLTSRFKTGAWELPIPVIELRGEEVREFLQIKAGELGVPFPIDAETARRVESVSGGLPLAIQWIVGQYKGGARRLEDVLQKVKDRDSPVLEFSFRNIWNTLGAESKTVLAVLSIFDGQATAQDLGIATEMRADAIENALAELVDVTLVTRSMQPSDGRVLYSALPITMAFARNQLSTMGDLEIYSRRRVQQFNQQLDLQATELARFRSDFETYGIEAENERRAAILCRRAQSEVFAGRTEEAELLFRQARDLAPASSYVQAMTASFELTRGRIGEALDRVEEACRRATKKTGALCYSIKAQILDMQRDRRGRLEALERAIQYQPMDVFLRHQYGVALSRMGREQDAINEFTNIITQEQEKMPPSDTYIAALTTRIINLQRLNLLEEARKDLFLGKELLAKFPVLDRPSSNRLRELIDEAQV